MANPWKSYFIFSRRERIGILVLLTLIVIIWLLPVFFLTEQPEVEELEWMSGELIGFRESTRPETVPLPPENPDTARAPKPFYFDPNRLGREGWQQLGLPERTITTIEKYRSRGGKFFRPEDFKKIFGLKPEEYNRLYPYIRIDSKEPGAARNAGPPARADKERQADPVPGAATIDINAADTSDFRKLRGIGPVLSRRMVAYRQKLGGFYSVDQLAEVYGLPDSTLARMVPQLECDASNIRKININTADEAVLKQHPYIKYQMAAAVIAYRQQHGPFRIPADIKKLHLVTDEVFEKLAPYLTVE